MLTIFLITDFMVQINCSLYIYEGVKPCACMEYISLVHCNLRIDADMNTNDQRLYIGTRCFLLNA